MSQENRPIINKHPVFYLFSIIPICKCENVKVQAQQNLPAMPAGSHIPSIFNEIQVGSLNLPFPLITSLQQAFTSTKILVILYFLTNLGLLLGVYLFVGRPQHYIQK